MASNISERPTAEYVKVTMKYLLPKEREQPGFLGIKHVIKHQLEEAARIYELCSEVAGVKWDIRLLRERINLEKQHLELMAKGKDRTEVEKVIEEQLHKHLISSEKCQKDKERQLIQEKTDVCRQHLNLMKKVEDMTSVQEMIRNQLSRAEDSYKEGGKIYKENKQNIMKSIENLGKSIDFYRTRLALIKRNPREEQSVLQQTDQQMHGWQFRDYTVTEFESDVEKLEDRMADFILLANPYQHRNSAIKLSCMS